MPDTEYAYLWFSLSLLAVALGLILVGRGQRRAMVAAGLLAAPAGALDLFFIPTYWNPITVLGTRVGPEDLIFSSATGVISCALAFGGASAGPATAARIGVAWNLYFAIVAGYVLWLATAWATGLRVMTAAVAGMILLGGALLWKTPALVRPALRGAVTFCVFYVAALAAAFAVWPDFRSQWGPPAWPGARLLAVPAGEIAWALVYGGVFPALFASVTDHRAVVAPAEPASADRLPLTSLDMEPDR